MLKLKIGICDDDDCYRNDIASKLNNYMINNDIDISYHTYSTGSELLQDYKSSGDFHILFLDIEMPEIDGLQLAEKIKRSIDKNVFIIFISNYPEYMQDSFRVHPFYYLVKPISSDILDRTMSDIIKTIEDEHILFTLISDDNTEETINIKEIRYIEVINSKKEILCFHLYDYATHTRGKITEWEKKLSEYHFFPCHRGILLNMAHIHYFEPHTAILDNGARVALSRRSEKKLRDMYTNNIVKLKNL